MVLTLASAVLTLFSAGPVMKKLPESSFWRKTHKVKEANEVNEVDEVDHIEDAEHHSLLWLQIDSSYDVI